MRRFQFWVLVIGSSLVSLMMVKQIFLSRELNQQQGVLVGSEDTASSAETYQTAWQKLAMAIYQASRQDPALAGILKDSNVEIHSKQDAPGATPTSDSNLAPYSANKAPTPPTPGKP